MKIVFLQSAEDDLKELRRYLRAQFGERTWKSSYEVIKQVTRHLQQFPDSGTVPPELQGIGAGRYRQVLAGTNRIIYERTPTVIFVHIICDTRRNLGLLLAQRISRRRPP
ncbi:MAG: type II toxin-antitoxin system RelE/ParE family toxin [Gammaproteobacteria bacterium]